jgi:hypothetical protein
MLSVLRLSILANGIYQIYQQRRVPTAASKTAE